MGTIEQVKDTERLVTIVINGREVEVEKGKISFAQLVHLSGLPKAENTIFTVTYRKGESNQQGTLVEGDSVEVKKGMVFNVTPTIRS